MKWLTPRAIARIRAVCLGITAFWFVLGGLAHFAFTDFLVRITPPWVPWPRAVVLGSGVLELLLAAALSQPRWRPAVGWALIAVICLVSLANVHMWMHPDLFPEAPRWVYTARLVLQAALIGCVWFGTRMPLSRSGGARLADAR